MSVIFFTAAENLPFAAALTVLCAIAILEGVGALIGASFSHLIHVLLPDANIDAIELPNMGMFVKFLAWMRIGPVPVLIVLINFLLIFGVFGFVIQSLSLAYIGHFLPMMLATGLTLPLTLLLTRLTTGLLEQVMPKDESDAVSLDSLIGRAGKVVVGHARSGYPAQAKVKDRVGKSHYVLVEPEINKGEEESILPQGCDILLLSRSSGVYLAIENTNQHLIA